MVAFISAGPEPVWFTYGDVMFKRALDVSVSWDTGAPAVKGRVFRSLNGGAEVRLPGPDLASGTRIEKILLGETLTFVLRRAPGGQEIGRSTVTTKKNAMAEYMTDPDLHFIFHLKVVPAVDTVGISFETKRPAYAMITVWRHDNGELADSWWSGDYRERHQAELWRSGSGYPQDTTFDVRIKVAKYPPRPGVAPLEIRGTFTTGSRTMTFFFDTIHVRNDGDPGGPGEFWFSFGVGDVLTQKQLGPVEFWGKGDNIPAGYDRNVDKVITINQAPRRMWAQVIAWESDYSLGDWLAGPFGLDNGGPDMRPGFDEPGSHGYELHSGSEASVTVHIDTEDTASDRFRPFQMSTGDFSIAYDVFGRTQVVRRNGTANFPELNIVSSIGRVKAPKPKVSKWAQVHSTLLAHGRTQAVALAAGRMSASLGPDGAVFVRTYDPRTREGYLADLGGEFRAPVTLVAAARETLYVVGLNPRGEVVVRTVTDDSPPNGDWANLGGAFTGTVTGVTRGRFVDLLASDAEGQVFHRTLPTDGTQNSDDWRRIGRGVRGAVAAVGSCGSELAVFGLGDDGRILHKRRTFDGEWRPAEGDEWQVLGTTDRATTAGGTIRAHWANETDLIVSVFVDDELAGALLWTGYPEPDRTTDWTPVEPAAGSPAPKGYTGL